MTEFGALNWTILAAYVVGAVLVGFLLSKRVRTAQHYYLGRKTTPWPVIGPFRGGHLRRSAGLPRRPRLGL